jgi:hypothetical protein
MMRKNGSSALKSSRSVIVVVMMGPVYVHACGSPGEVSELDRRRSSDLWTLSLGREPIKTLLQRLRSVLRKQRPDDPGTSNEAPA